LVFLKWLPSSNPNSLRSSAYPPPQLADFASFSSWKDFVGNPSLDQFKVRVKEFGDLFSRRAMGRALLDTRIEEEDAK